MSWWRRGGRTPGRGRSASAADLAHLRGFVGTRRGVEAYLEPATAVTATTVVLVASDGEWTRRRVASPAAAASFARKHAIPLYEAARTGYPRRMREWDARCRADGNDDVGDVTRVTRVDGLTPPDGPRTRRPR